MVSIKLFLHTLNCIIFMCHKNIVPPTIHTYSPNAYLVGCTKTGGRKDWHKGQFADPWFKKLVQYVKKLVRRQKSLLNMYHINSGIWWWAGWVQTCFTKLLKDELKLHLHKQLIWFLTFSSRVCYFILYFY